MHKLILPVIFLVCHTLAFQARAEEPQPKITPTNIRMAFVNDGSIFLVGRDGQISNSGVSGISPVLSPDGQKLLYTGIQKTEKVYPASPQYPRYGTTYALTGVYLWDLETGVRKKLSDVGEAMDISPGPKALITKDKMTYIVGLPDGKAEKVDSARDAFWLGDNEILYEKSFQIWQYNFKTKKRAILMKSPGLVLKEGLGDDPSRLLKTIFSNKTVSGQQNLRSFADGSKVAFVQFDVSITEEKYSLVYVDEALNISYHPLISVQGSDPRLGPILRLAVSKDGAKIAFARKDKFKKTEAVFVAQIPTQAQVVLNTPAITQVCEYSSIDELTFWDSDTLLVCVIDKAKTYIPLEGGATLVIGARQLEPSQIEMMGLNKSICEADTIYRVDLKTKEQHVFSSGHDMAIPK